MKITFYSNFMNHHQLPLCQAFYKQFGYDFTFVASMSTAREQINLGYDDMNKNYPFILTTYDSQENVDKAKQLAIDSDVIIHGSAEEMYITQRMKHNKLTFRYSERLNKKGWLIYLLSAVCFVLPKNLKYRNKNLYLLCAGAYVSADYKKIGLFENKAFKWGYFPEFKSYDIDNIINNKKSTTIKIMWAGRFLKWKHPELAVELAKILEKSQIDFKMYLIGDGKLKQSLHDKVNQYRLQDRVYFTGAISHLKVREYMEKSDIFLLTSDRNEGWGAVLNEAMSSGCAVVASHEIGSVPYLIKHEENGLIYESLNLDDLVTNVKKYIDDDNFRYSCAKKAYYTIKDSWNAEVAASEFIELVNSIQTYTCQLNTNEVCETAPLYTTKDIYQYLENSKTTGVALKNKSS